MDKQDELSNGKTIYEASSGEVFWKNFLAGFGRGLGGMFVYLILIVVVYFLFMTIVMPKLTPYIAILTNLTKSLESLSNVKNNPAIVIPSNITIPKLFGQ